MPNKFALLKQFAAAVATSRAGHRQQQRSGREGQHRRWDRGPALSTLSANPAVCVATVPSHSTCLCRR